MGLNPDLTADSYERLVAGLRGRAVIAVDYYVLSIDEEGRVRKSGTTERGTSPPWASV